VELNLNSLTVDESGRVTLSGLGSGIDFVSAVDQMIAARRLPVDRLEANIEANSLKIQAYQEMKLALGTFQDSLDTLRGAVSVDNTKNIFSAKQAFATVSRTDGTTASAAANLLGVTVTNSATGGTHEIEVLQVARSHKIASDSFASTSTELGFADGDEFTIEGKTITLAAGDSLLDLRDRINAANTGTSPTQVSASIVTVSDTEHYLVMTKNTAGTAISVSETTNTPLQTVGILDGSGNPANQLQAAQTAQVYADGLLDKTNTTYESARQASASTTLGSSGTLRFDDGTTTRDLAYLSSESITTLANNINGDATLQSMGVSASIVQEGAQFRLKIVTTGDPFTIAEQGAGSVSTDLSINNSRLLIERNSNTVNDLFTGMTLSIFQAEVGTNIKIDIEQDLSAVKSEIAAFVEAYNALKVFINGQTQIDESTGKIPEEAMLIDSQTLHNIENQMSQLLGFGVAGVSEDYSVLAQIGIKFVNNAALTDPLLRDTLEIDDSTLDTALLNNADDVRRLFNFDFSSSDPRLTLLSFSGTTTYNAAGYTININYDDRYQTGAITEAGSFTEVDAQTGGPASDGIGNIAFDDSVASGQAFRYSYASATEELTVVNLTTGASQTVDITASLDAAAGTGLDLGAGQTVDIDFATLGVTLTLSGDDGFLRGTDISDGALDTSAFTTLNMTGGAVATPASGMDATTVNALIAAGAYDASTGLLTLSIDGTVSSEGYLQTAAGLLFSLDGGPVASDISATNIADGAAHTIDIYVNDGSSDVQVASLSFSSLTNPSAGGVQTLTIDLGTGLIAETSTITNADSPMENYLTTPALGNGSFNIRDSSNTVIGTFAYDATDSLTDLANAINADPDLNATIISSGGTFRLEVTHITNDTLTFTDDTDTLISQLTITNNGNSVYSANVGGSADGADDGTITVSNNTLIFTDQSGAQGLQLLYTGNTNLGGLQIDFTQGIGSRLYFAVDDILDETTGAVANEIEGLDDQNDFTQERIDLLLERLERQRQSLLERFIAMETALTQMNAILDSIKQSFEVLTSRDN
jgi:flagellar hook-associated protein 2